MDNLWENAPWFVPTMRRKDYLAELEHEVEDVNEKNQVLATSAHIGEVKD